MLRELSIPEQKSLLDRMSDGDIKAFRAIFDAYNTPLYTITLKITKSSYSAEEIVQETFAILWESRLKLKDIENPRAYLFTVAYNKAFSYLKKIAKNQDLKEMLRNQIHEARNDIEEWMDIKETRELIDQAVEKMPPRRQLIFKLSREESLSHKEIAEKLHISPLTVKKQMVIALKNIRSMLHSLTPLLALAILSFYYSGMAMPW